MIEDVELNRLVKEAFEESRAFELRRPHVSSYRRLGGWGIVTALAASLAVVILPRVFADGGEENVSVVIDLLSEVDGLATDSSAMLSAEEKLLAWQDAPIAEIL